MEAAPAWTGQCHYFAWAPRRLAALRRLLACMLGWVRGFEPRLVGLAFNPTPTPQPWLAPLGPRGPRTVKTYGALKYFKSSCQVKRRRAWGAQAVQRRFSEEQAARRAAAEAARRSGRRRRRRWHPHSFLLLRLVGERHRRGQPEQLDQVRLGSARADRVRVLGCASWTR